jgi:hypothetical protein
MTRQTRSPKSAASPPVVDLPGFDQALGAIVASGWSQPHQSLDAGFQEVPEPLQQPLPAPMQEPARQWIEEQRQVVAQAQGLQYPPLPARRERDPDQEVEPPNKALLDIGLLTDFVTGSRNAEDTAAAAGVTINELHSALATTLAQVDARELAKAMGVQVAVTQLKAGAVFNALLADLVEDIRAGRAKADVKLELMKILKGVGRLEPREDKGVGIGGGFQLNINIGQGVPPVTIEAKE